MPSAFIRQFKSSFSMRQRGDAVYVSGDDLIEPLAEVVRTADGYVLFLALTCNPCYWMGTRVATVASAYQNFRPVMFTVHYVPQVSVTTPGTVICGTLWNTPASVTSFQQSMVTSNGGAMSQCYVPFSSRVRLGSALPQNLFTCAGNLDPDHNPFVFLALMRGADVVPGYFHVSYTYELRNPLGYSVEYAMFRADANAWDDSYENISGVTLSPLPGFAGPGLVFDVETETGPMYNGSPITLPNTLKCLMFANTANVRSERAKHIHASLQSVLITGERLAPGTYLETIGGYFAWNWATGDAYGIGWWDDGHYEYSFDADFDSNTFLFWYTTNDHYPVMTYVYSYSPESQRITDWVLVTKSTLGSLVQPNLIMHIDPLPSADITAKRCSAPPLLKAAPSSDSDTDSESPACSTTKPNRPVPMRPRPRKLPGRPRPTPGGFD